jgi:hypothetical protein
VNYYVQCGIAVMPVLGSRNQILPQPSEDTLGGFQLESCESNVRFSSRELAFT